MCCRVTTSTPMIIRNIYLSDVNVKTTGGMSGVCNKNCGPVLARFGQERFEETPVTLLPNQ